MNLIYAFCCAAASLALISCGSSHAALHQGRPSVLRYAFSTNMEDPDLSAHRGEVTARYLERELHVKVELVKTTAYAAVIEAFRANKIDAASIAPFSYVLASQKVPIEAIVMRGTPNGEPGEYNGILAVRADSPIHSIDDLKQHSKELTISFVDPASTSGFLAENAFLQSIGLEPERDFKKVVFSMNHPNSLLALKTGKVDVASGMLRLVQRYEDTGKFAKGEIRVIWTSPDLPNQPIAVRKDLPPDFKKEIQRAFIEMAQKDQSAWASQSPTTMPMPAGQVYVAATDAMFDGLRKMARGVKNLSLLEQ